MKRLTIVAFLLAFAVVPGIPIVPAQGLPGGRRPDPIDRATGLANRPYSAPPPSPEQEFEALDDEPDVDAAKARAMRQRMRMVARQVAMNPDDGIEL